MKNGIIILNQKEIASVFGGMLQNDAFNQRIADPVERNRIFCFICLLGCISGVIGLAALWYIRDTTIENFNYYIKNTVYDLYNPEQKEKKKALQTAANNPFL